MLVSEFVSRLDVHDITRQCIEEEYSQYFDCGVSELLEKVEFDVVPMIRDAYRRLTVDLDFNAEASCELVKCNLLGYTFVACSISK